MGKRNLLVSLMKVFAAVYVCGNHFRFIKMEKYVMGLRNRAPTLLVLVSIRRGYDITHFVAGKYVCISVLCKRKRFV